MGSIIDEEETSSLCENEREIYSLEVSSPEVYLIEDPGPAPSQFKKGSQATLDELLEINLATEYEPRPTFIIRRIVPKENEVCVNFVKKVGILSLEIHKCLASI